MKRLRVALATLAVLFPVLLAGAYWYMVQCEGHWEGTPLEASMGEELRRLEDRLRTDVAFLSDTLGPRNPDHPEALARAERWIRDRWEAQGYSVAAQRLVVDDVETSNLEIEIPGRTRPSEIVLVSAQFDTWPDSPGANNNGSGTAVLLHLSEMLAGQPADRTVRLVAFTVQEPPYHELGSQRYASRARRRGDDIRIMLSMDAIGIYRHEPGTQQLPFPFDLLYPDRGNFLAFIGDLRTRPRVVEATRGFRRGSAFPIEAGAVPRWVEGASWSDHESFWNAGYPAIQITDTGAFRSPSSHTTSEDTMEKIDFRALARITVGMYGAVRELAYGSDG